VYSQININSNFSISTHQLNVFTFVQDILFLLVPHDVHQTREIHHTPGMTHQQLSPFTLRRLLWHEKMMSVPQYFYITVLQER
jgi:hypothetical protein